MCCNSHNTVLKLWVGLGTWNNTWIKMLLVATITDGGGPTSCEKLPVLVATERLWQPKLAIFHGKSVNREGWGYGYSVSSASWSRIYSWENPPGTLIVFFSKKNQLFRHHIGNDSSNAHRTKIKNKGVKYRKYSASFWDGSGWKAFWKLMLPKQPLL